MNISLLFRSALFIGLLSSFAAAQEGAKKIPCGELLPKSFLSANFQGGISYAETSDDNNGKLASCRVTIRNGKPGMVTGLSVTVWDKETGYQLSLDRLTKSAETKADYITGIKVTDNIGVRSFELTQKVTTPGLPITSNLAYVYFTTPGHRFVCVTAGGSKGSPISDARRIAKEAEANLARIVPGAAQSGNDKGSYSGTEGISSHCSDLMPKEEIGKIFNDSVMSVRENRGEGGGPHMQCIYVLNKVSDLIALYIRTGDKARAYYEREAKKAGSSGFYRVTDDIGARSLEMNMKMGGTHVIKVVSRTPSGLVVEASVSNSSRDILPELRTIVKKAVSRVK